MEIKSSLSRIAIETFLIGFINDPDTVIIINVENKEKEKKQKNKVKKTKKKRNQ